MTEQQRPLSRRERRLREMAESGVIELDQEQLAQAGEPAAGPSAAELAEAELAEKLLAEIEIPAVNEDGTPRSRREMRQLRDAALQEALAKYRAENGAEGLAEQGAADAAADAVSEAAEAAPVQAEEPVSAPVEDDAAEAADAAAVVAAAEDLRDDDAAPPTVAFTLDELREAETPKVEEELTVPQSDPFVELFGVPAADVEEEAAAEESAADEPAAAEEAAAEVAEPAAETAAGEETAAAAAAEETPAEEAASAPDAAAEAAEAGEEASASEEAAASVADAAEKKEEKPKTEYSFPVIEPLEENFSVFDADSPHRVESGEQIGFDALLERAVADEGTGGATSVPSAVILPEAPEDTGLVGPLNETGELFITGSLRLPKSLSETGGHARLHDSVQYDEPLVQQDDAAVQELLAAAEDGPVPVSARNAVSAQSESGLAGLSKPAKDNSKKPLVLGLIGGGLVVVVAGVTVIVMRVLGV